MEYCKGMIMLILTRREGEVVRIGNDITIKVLRLTHGQIRIGIEAPLSTPVHREEIYQRIQQDIRDNRVEEPEKLYS